MSYKRSAQNTNEQAFNVFRLTYDEAVELLNKIQKITPLEYGQDIGAFHEKALLDYFEGIPLFITHYPANLKAFYMKRDGDKVRLLRERVNTYVAKIVSSGTVLRLDCKKCRGNLRWKLKRRRLR